MQLIEFLRFRRDNCLKAKVAEGTVKEACDCPVCSATDSGRLTAFRRERHVGSRYLFITKWLI